MQLSSDKIAYSVGSAETAYAMPSAPAMTPFDDGVLDFLQALSEKLRPHREYSDVATFAFWCRRAAMQREKLRYDDIDARLGRGVVFHIAPSNVPVNFAFSLVCGLLAGNANIVRMPSRPFAQVELIASAVGELLSDVYPHLAPYVCLVRYPADAEINDAFSQLCDVRVIWGGDGTVAQLRKSPLKPRACEICFADRYSMAVIDSDAYMASEGKEETARAFYNDTYFSDQNACTSPRIVFWTGNSCGEARKEFWRRLHTLVKRSYALSGVQSVGKLDAAYRAAVFTDVRVVPSPDMLLTRLEAGRLDSGLMDYKYNSGFFYEMEISSLADMLPLCGERCQTLSYFGIKKEDMAQFLRIARPRGIDRAVPLGKTMDFSLVWDGCDLIRTMSRRVEVL